MDRNWRYANTVDWFRKWCWTTSAASLIFGGSVHPALGDKRMNLGMAHLGQLVSDFHLMKIHDSFWIKQVVWQLEEKK